MCAGGLAVAPFTIYGYTTSRAGLYTVRYDVSGVATSADDRMLATDLSGWYISSRHEGLKQSCVEDYRDFRLRVFESQPNALGESI